MNKNTYSLFNSSWMMSDASASAMIPFLITLSKGMPLPVAVAPDQITVMYERDGEDSFNVVQDVRSDAKYIPVLAIKNTIYKYDQECGPRGTQTMMALMEDWKGNDNVMGVVLDFDSGGGQGAGTREFARFIKKYPKPVVAYSNGMICSAAYWLAAACNGGIIINECADFIGSVGAKGKYVNLDGILTKEGAIIKDIYASQSTRKDEEARAMSERGDDSLIKSNIMDPCAQYIIDDVKAFRPKVAKEIFEGAIYQPAKALELGLVDKFGALTDAFDVIIEKSKANSTSNNPKSNTMSKTLANVQAVLGLSAPLAATAENGSYLNAEQLDKLENELSVREAQASTLQTAVDTANAVKTKAEADLAAANTAHTAALASTEAAVDAMLTSAAQPVTGTLTEKLAALTAHQEVLNKKDGAAPTKVITDPKPAETSAGYVNPTASHNLLADQISKKK